MKRLDSATVPLLGSPVALYRSSLIVALLGVPFCTSNCRF